MSYVNSLGQPIGPPLPNWNPPPYPQPEVLLGRYCRVEPLDLERHAADLYAADSLGADGRQWTYLSIGPFENFDQYRAWAEAAWVNSDLQFYAIVSAESGKAVGIAAYLRIMPESGSIEVGHLLFSPLLQGTRAATEAMYLMMARAFALGYRRYEWKCDALNARSRAAAQRLGFSYEGVFRNATVYKGRSRDTAWFAIIDTEWPALKARLEQWLDPGNFDERGQQRVRLSALTRPLLFQRDPSQEPNE